MFRPFFYYLYTVQEKHFNENGEIQPEKRLPAACVGAFFIPVCLFWFGWSARPDIHWIMPIIGSSFFSMGAMLLFNSVLNYLSDAYPDYVASVLAGNDIMRSSFGAGFPLFARAMYINVSCDPCSQPPGSIGSAMQLHIGPVTDGLNSSVPPGRVVPLASSQSPSSLSHSCSTT